jgi:hypothetical protein
MVQWPAATVAEGNLPAIIATTHKQVLKNPHLSYKTLWNISKKWIPTLTLPPL